MPDPAAEADEGQRSQMQRMLDYMALKPGQKLTDVPIDVVFIDRRLRVVRCVPALAPWRLAASPGAFAVIELPAGAAARRGLRPGRVLGPDSTLEEPSR